MIHSIALAAHRLDAWLQAHLGRPYNVLLGIGLTVEIIRRLVELPQHAVLGPQMLGMVVLIVMNLALLIHQVGPPLPPHRPSKSPAGRAAGPALRSAR